MRFAFLLTAAAALWTQPAGATATLQQLNLSGMAAGTQRAYACNGVSQDCIKTSPFSTPLSLSLSFSATAFADGEEAFSYGNLRAEGLWTGTIRYLGDGLFSGVNLSFARISPSMSGCGRTCFGSEEYATAATFSVTDGAMAARLAPAAAPAVPEPSTWALMLAGFGAIGAAMRRRGVRALWPERQSST